MADPVVNAEQLGRFYEAALNAGAILVGFMGTFLSFRIQREANYHRQPVLEFGEDRAGRGKDAVVGLSRFNSSFLLIILGAMCAIWFGVFCPLAALANWGRFTLGPGTILGGVVAALVLVASYFVNELMHYAILKPSRFRKDLAGWSKAECVLVVGGILTALLLSTVTYFGVRRG